MEGSPLEGDMGMQVDEQRRDVETALGNNSENAQDGPVQDPLQTSPISSDVAPSSQSGGSEASPAPNGDNTATYSHTRIPTQTTNVTITSATTSRTTSAYSSPRSQPSGSGSALSASLKSTTSGRRKSTTSGVPFPIIMASSPASPRMDSTTAEAEDMVGIVSAEDVRTYVSDTARRPSIPVDSASVQVKDKPTSERLDSDSRVRQRRVSSPEHTFRHTQSSTAIPIASSSRRPDFNEPFAGSLTRSYSTEQAKSISSQQQRFKRFMGNLFRSKSVSSTESVRSTEDDGIASTSVAGSNGLATVGETRSPRRAQSMIPSVPPAPTSIPRSGSKPDTQGSYTTSPSVMSSHSAHPGSVTPRIRTRSERSTSPGRTTHRQTTTTDVEMELDEKEGSSDGGDPAYPLKRVRSCRDQPTTAAGTLSTSGGKADWKCRPTGSAGLDGVVSGLGLG
jgi:hypothetical protein